MRKRIKTAAGRTTKTAPWLLAMFTAMALTVTSVVPSLQAENAMADETALPENGGLYFPSSGTIGQDITNGTTDTGVATWVGRDMYIGEKPGGAENQDATVALTGDMNSGLKPVGSYAVEAEGLTLVKGKLAINQIKNSWGFTPKDQPTVTEYPGFRFGAVGFGAMYRPANGSVALAVSGSSNSLITSMYTGNKVQSVDGTSVSVGAWNHGGWVGGAAGHWENGKYIYTDAATGETPYFTASLAGPTTYWASEPYQNHYDGGESPRGRASIVQKQGAWATQSSFWRQPDDPLKDVNGVDYLNYDEDTCGDFGDTIRAQSQQLAGMTMNGSYATSTINSGTINRQKYGETGEGKQKVYIDYGKNQEKKITFTGTGDKSDTIQVFNIPASELNNDGGTNGIAFAFEGIPVVGKDDKGKDVYASVVVNVMGDGNVDFHNGWHFYWGTDEIGGAFHKDSPLKDKYDAAAKSIMWNFANAGRVTIRGGRIIADTAYWDSEKKKPIDIRSSEDGRYITSDDPAAAMLGSIMVPNGTFDDHVTTNGRVWVGKDFMMNSPHVLKKGNDDYSGTEGVPTASIIDMDMERHNYGWSASYADDATTIAWKKVDRNGTPLAGTEFGVYAKLADAQNRENALYTITDNDSTDEDKAEGAFQVGRLKPGNSYYVREINPHDDAYKRNDNIYRIQAASAGQIYASIDKVFNSSGTAIDSDLNGGAIVNTPTKGDIGWTKYEAGDEAKTPLYGSEWKLTKTDGGNQQEWHVAEDEPIAITGVTISYNGTAVTDEVYPTYNTVLNLSAQVVPAGAYQGVKWESDNDALTVSNGVVQVNSTDLGGAEYATITATSLADPTKSDTMKIKPLVAQLNVKRLDVMYKCRVVTNTTTPLAYGAKTIKVKADFELQEGDSANAIVNWTVVSGGGSIQSSGPAAAVLTLPASGTVTIRASLGGLDREASFEVTDQPPAPKNITVYTNNNGWNLYYYNPSDDTQNNKWPGESMKDAGNGWYRTVIDKDYASISFMMVNGNNGSNHFGFSLGSPANGITLSMGQGASCNDIVTVDRTYPYYIVDGISIRGSATPPSGVSTVSDTMDANTAANAMTRAQARAEAAQVNDVAEDAAVEPAVVNDSGVRAAAKLDVPANKWEDVNPIPGQFHLMDLADGEYELQEIKAPDGFVLPSPNPVYKFKVTNGQAEWTDGPAGITGAGMGYVANSPNSYEWEKIDAGYDPAKPNTEGDRLAGTTWKLEVFTKAEGAQTGKYDTAEGFGTIVDCTAGEGKADECTGPDKDPVGGKFKIEKLKIGKYRLNETAAPSGYIVEANKYYYFEIDAKSGTVLQAGTQTSFDKATGAFKAESATSRSGGSSTVNNFRKPGTAGWEKVTTDGETTRHLKGAEWSMRYQSLANQKPVTDITLKITDSDITCTVTGTETACSGDDLAWATGLTNKATGDGEYSFEGLPWGTYTVTETKAPDGYNLDSTPHEFVIRPLTAGEKPNGTSVGIEGDNQFTVNLGSIENTPGVVLPETGGEGSSWVVMLGFALTAIAMLGCGLALSRRTA